MTFKIGNTVSWRTHGRTNHTRAGEIIQVVQPGNMPNFPLYVGNHNFKSIDAPSPRNHVSYLVSVKAPGKNQPLLYWPRADRLTLVMGDTTGIGAVKAAASANGVSLSP